MTLSVFKDIIDAAVLAAGKTAPHVQVRITNGKDKFYDVQKVTQFEVVPDVYIYIGEKL